jgi:ribosomal protein L5
MLLALAARVCAAEAAAAAPAVLRAAPAIGGRLDDAHRRCASSSRPPARHRAAAHTSAAPSAAAKQQQQQQAEQQQQQQQQQQPPSLPPPPFEWQRPRLETLYRDHVARALMLKLDVASVNELPSVGAVSVAVRAGDAAAAAAGSTPSAARPPSRARGGASSENSAGVVEKWEMLLPALALEFLTGQPASLAGPKGQYYRERGAASAARAALRGRAALHLLEKLSAVALPGQSAFEGVLARAVDASGGVHFRLPSMLAFPDYEEAYETFEGLRAAHVSVGVDPGTWRPRGARRRLGGDAPAEAEAARQRRRRRRGAGGGAGGEGEEGGGGGGEDEEDEDVDAAPVGVARPRGAQGPAAGAVAARTQLLLTGLQFPLLSKRRGPPGRGGDDDEDEDDE